MLDIDARSTQNEHLHRGIGGYFHGLLVALLADGIEGMSAAAPLQEVAGRAALVVPIDDVDALATAMVRLLRDTAEQDRRAAAGLARAAEFSRRRSAVALREVTWPRQAGDLQPPGR